MGRKFLCRIHQSKLEIDLLAVVVNLCINRNCVLTEIGGLEWRTVNVPIGTANPGCIVILVDQSWSMTEDWGDGTKAEVAALAVNRILEELVLDSQAGDEIKPRCHVSVIGYGERVECVVDGMISEVASSLLEVKKVKKSIPDGAGGIVEVEVEMPIWVQPEANNDTPMHEAF